MKNLKNKVAVITGAGSGIGRALAVRLCAAGCDVAISDIDIKNLKETATMIQDRGGRVFSGKLDVAKRQAVYSYADKVQQEFGKVNIVINNAGVALGARIEDMDYEDFEWLMNINFWGVVYGTKAFLPLLKQAGDGHIVNISSVFGLIAVPTQAAYNAAKFAVRGFTEALRIELDDEKCGVSATSVHPGGIKTNIVRNSRMGDLGEFARNKDTVINDFDRLAKTSPEDAAKTIIDGIKKNKRRVLIGKDAIAIDSMQRMLPTGYQRVFAFQKNKN